VAGILRVKKWNEFQHYKGRNPPWIKLHKSFLDNAKFQRLPVDSRALAPMIWLLASESKDGTVDYDLADIGFRLRMSVLELEAAIVPLISGGFLEMERDASAVIAESKPDAMPETEAERETEAEAEREGAQPSAAVVVKQETSNTRTRGTRLADDWEPDEQDREYARQFGWDDERIATEGANIRDWSRSSRNGVKLDWHAAWRTWVRRKQADQPLRGRKPAKRTAADDNAAILGALGLADGLGGTESGYGTNAVVIDGESEPGSIDAHAGSDDQTSGREGLRGGDGAVVQLGENVRDRRGTGGGDEAVPGDARGFADRPSDAGDRSNDPGARIPQSPEAAGNSVASDRGIDAPAQSADDRTNGAGNEDPFDIPEFLRRKAS
jgi:hypothetical protein